MQQAAALPWVLERVARDFAVAADAAPAEVAARLYDEVHAPPRAAPTPSDVNLAWEFQRRLAEATAGGMGTLDGGFYRVRSDAPPAPRGPETRVYFNVCRQGAPRLVHEVTRRLGAAGEPFVLKVRDDPAAFRRANAAILLFGREQYDAVRPHLLAAWSAARPWLADAVPAFARALGWGIAVAESPADRAVSFGRHRCALLAAGLVDAARRGVATPEGRRAAIVRAVADAGIDPAFLHLDGGAHDPY